MAPQIVRAHLNDGSNVSFKIETDRLASFLVSMSDARGVFTITKGKGIETDGRAVHVPYRNVVKLTELDGGSSNWTLEAL